MNELSTRSSIILGRPVYRGFGETAIVQNTIRVGLRAHNVVFWIRGAKVHARMEPFVTLSLLPAMKLGAKLISAHPVCSRLLEELQVIQGLFRSGLPDLDTAESELHGNRSEVAQGKGIGLFFSGGVDSFYALLEYESKVSHLVFVHGFDIRLGHSVLFRKALARVESVARWFGKSLVIVRTNLRDFTDPYTLWGAHSHGPALGAVAQLLGGTFKAVYIAGEFIEGAEAIHASRASVDPLWSTSYVDILHVGHKIPRFEKLRAVSTLKPAQGSLRVCWENRHGRLNCCECSKCLRNMAGLRALGRLGDFTSFESPLNLDRVAVLELSPSLPHHELGIRQMLACAEAREEDADLIAALRACLRNNNCDLG